VFSLKRPPARIAVLLPTLNSARYVAEAIESILRQSWSDLELVVLDGGSTDATLGIVRAFAALDQRVRLAVFPGVHPTQRVDTWLRRTRSEFVALQHSDDISYPQRLARQVRAFEKNPALGVCSAAYRSFWHDREGPAPMEGATVHPKPATHAEIKSQLLFWWVMHAPILMLRREKILAAGLGFANDFQFANDYWQTVANIDRLQYCNVQEELSAYRLHAGGDGPRNVEHLRREERVLKERVLSHFGFSFTPRELELHLALKLIPDGQLLVRTRAEHDEARQWLENLRAQNDRRKVFDGPLFSALLDQFGGQIAELQNLAG
jgi:glycosyltransferase involved in cell wall biosynthesis